MADAVPEDFPDELRPHANAAYRILCSIAADTGAKAVKARSLAHVIMARPRYPIVRGAHDWAAWAVSVAPRRRPKDVVSSYRNWLDNETELAALEVLPGAAAGPLPANVTPLREPRTSEERRAARQRTRLAVARGELDGSALIPEQMRLGTVE